MPAIHNVLMIEQLTATELAQQFGTPCYVYSLARLRERFQAFSQALSIMPHRICYSVKANSNLAILQQLALMGAGFDIVSGGELERVLQAGGSADRVVFSGVGKQDWELVMALEAGIHCFNVESAAELMQLESLAATRGLRAPVSLRVNPDVDAKTHPYIATGLKENKFGIAMDEAYELYQHAAASSSLAVIGVDCHIGSQLTELQPMVDALQRVLSLVDRLHRIGIDLDHVDIGGGLGVRYQQEDTPPTPADYAQALQPLMQGRPLTLFCEPGRALVADAGTLLTRVVLLKSTPARNFAVVDAAMNDLIRPTLYQAWMSIEVAEPAPEDDQACYDIVGPVCETGDFLGKDRHLRLHAGSLLAISQAGAYGFVMSSNYNTRTRAAEVMVDGNQAYLVRRRETLQDLLALESLLPEHT